jgi:hypothetical protein
MKIRNYIAFSALITLVLAAISGIIIYLAPVDSEAIQQGWNVLFLPKFVWKAQFVVSTFLFFLFTIWFVFLVNWKVIYQHIRKEFPGKIQNSKELWIALIIPFLIFMLTALELQPFRSIAKMDEMPVKSTPVLTEDLKQDAEEINVAEEKKKPDAKRVKSLTAIGDLSMELMAENYISLTAEQLLNKLKAKPLKIKGIQSTMYEVADDNNMSVNQLYKIIAENEEINPKVRHGKPVSLRTVSEASREIGISTEQVFAFFDKEKLKHSGSIEETLKEIADNNNRQPMDLYAGLSGREMTRAASSQMNDQKSGGLAQQSQSLTIDQIVEVIKRQQPESDVDKQKIIARLRMNQLKVSDPNATLGIIAKENNTSVDDIISVISSGKRKTGNSAMSGGMKNSNPQNLEKSAEQLEQDKAAAKKRRQKLMNSSLTELAAIRKVKPSQMIAALRAKGIEATESESVHQIARRTGRKPGEVFRIVKSAGN